jgi:ABC-type transport system involved in cytochrome bd biosynthesis fused ATPase/permease subunit
MAAWGQRLDDTRPSRTAVSSVSAARTVLVATHSAPLARAADVVLTMAHGVVRPAATVDAA